MEQIWHEGKRRLGMQLLVREGIFASIMYAMTSVFLVAFALALGANAFYVGLLNSIPNVFWTIALVPSAILTQHYMRKRKSILVGATTLSRLMWLGILMLPIAFTGWSLAGLMVFVTLASIISAFSSPAWASITGDIVPDYVRGRYFSRRLAYTTVAGLGAELIAGWVLDFFGRGNMFGFIVIFGVGMLAGLTSSALLWQVPEPPLQLEHRAHTISAMRNALRDGRLRRFLLALGFFEFAVMVASPFFTVHLLNALRAEYIWIAILAVASGVAGISVQRAWGRFSDRYGHRVILIISAFWIVLVPLLWIPVPPEYLYLLVVAEAFSGAVWAGYNLSYFNYMLEISPVAERPVYSALTNVVFGVAGITGPVIGGLIASAFVVSPLFGIAGITEIRAVFLVSGILRMIGAAMLGLLLMEAIEKRERVAPSHVFSEMVRSGLLGTLLKAHNAAGLIKHDAFAAKNSLRGAITSVEKSVASTVKAIENAIDHVAIESDKEGDKIAEHARACLFGTRVGEKANYRIGKKLRVKVSE
ncbi:MAG: MFS transporter [Candidatus Aenigmatarchaeota archaeon]